MAIETKEVPYELLFRWSQQGALNGAHFQKRYVILNDGHVVGESVGNPEPIDPAGAAVLEIMTAEQANSVVLLAGLEARQQAIATELNQRLETIDQERLAQEDAHARLLRELDAQRSAFELEREAFIEVFATKEEGYLARIAALETELANAQEALPLVTTTT